MYYLSEELFYKNIGEELMIFDKENKETYLLDEVGKDIFYALDKHTFDEVIDSLLKLYNTQREEIVDDVKEIISQLNIRGFIRED